MEVVSQLSFLFPGTLACVRLKKTTKDRLKMESSPGNAWEGEGRVAGEKTWSCAFFERRHPWLRPSDRGPALSAALQSERPGNSVLTGVHQILLPGLGACGRGAGRV